MMHSILRVSMLLALPLALLVARPAQSLPVNGAAIAGALSENPINDVLAVRFEGGRGGARGGGRGGDRANFNRSSASRENIGRNASRSVDRGGNRGADRGGNRNVDRNANRNLDRNANRNVNRNANRNVNRNANRDVNRNVNRDLNRTVGAGGWVRPANYWWRPGGAVAAGAAIGFVSAATAAAWAGAPPMAGYCWYYTDSTRQQGFWDQCP